MLTSQSHKHAALIALSAFAALVACIFGFAPHAMADSSGAAEGGSDATLKITSVSELAGKKVGMLNGGIFDLLLANNVEGVSQDDFMYFNSNAETVGALITGKIDAMITDLPIAQFVSLIKDTAVVGYIAVHHLLPSARKHGLYDPRIVYTVSVAENGETAQLSIDLARFIEAGIDLDEIRNDADKISAKMMRQILSDQTLSSDGVLTSTIA